MALSWNEIKDRAIAFSKEWKHEGDEAAEAKSFLDALFNVYGVTRRRVGTFEKSVHKDGNKIGRIDFLWKGKILIEMKSIDRNLDRAYKQATDYFQGLQEHELPRYILVCDFEKFRLYDLDEDTQHDFLLKDFYKNTKLFGFFIGYQKKEFKEQDPVNIKAAELMGKLHDNLKALGYEGHELEVYLVRLLYCLFADDTTIFENDIFHEYIEKKTAEDGSDLGMHLSMLFQVLNTAPENRMKNTDEHLAAFPYVNGKLFEEQLHMASFNSAMRKSLLECCGLNWGIISPAIFGSMFQSVMNPKERRNLGAHYTSEKNIMKVIKTLFLDEYQAEFEKIKRDRKALQKFHNKLASLKFLDPACGCGNFLVLTYRELRVLELEILKVLQEGQQVTSINDLVKIDVDQFYGIEYEEFPAQIAPVALWLMDHQMNLKVMEAFGFYSRRLPLKKSARIVHGNALQIDWISLATKKEITIEADVTNIIVNEPNAEYDIVNVYSKSVNIIDRKTIDTSLSDNQYFDFILGNPPFIGMSLQSKEQAKDMENVFAGLKGAGVLDYVTAWYKKAAQLIMNTKTKVAFVSTNSITQGEQAATLWTILFNLYKVKIHFAHRTFNWRNEASGNAAVHVVIIGFANFDISEKRIFEYADIKGEPHEIKVKNISPYLVEGKDFVINSRNTVLCNVPKMSRGNSPYDNGNLIFTNEEVKDFLLKEPNSKKYIKELISAKEFLNGKKRWCLWLLNADPTELRKLPLVQERLKKVYEFRINSKGAETRKYATTPSLFRDRNNPKSFIVIPRVSSENRKYIPIGFFDMNSIVSDTCMFISEGKIYHFGILTSTQHMSWVKHVCGRLKSDFRYSKDIVYNNFPWPENITDKQKQAIEKAAQKVLDARKEFQISSPQGRSGGASLADLYDPLTMPPALVKAHNELDKAVDLSYRSQPFTTETKRIEFLFELYEKYTAGMFAGDGKKKKKN